MIIVNTPGDWGNTFGMLLHAPWHGFTPTDWVFPAFLFAVGNAMAFVEHKWEGQERSKVLTTIFKRAFLIFAIGYLLRWFPFFRLVDGEWVFKSIVNLRIFGVLQRIAVCYLIAALLIYLTSKRTAIVTSVVILLGYWLILFAFGDYTLEGNTARKLDLWLLGDSYLWQGLGVPFEPEGILSSFPATVNVIAGYLIGKYLKEGIDYEKLAKLLLIGATLTATAYLWHPLFPINKNIWTSSYVLLSTGLSAMLVAMLIYVMEFKANPWRLGFFKTFGMNPLFSFVLSILIVKILFIVKVDGQSGYSLLYQNAFAWIGGKFGSLAFALFIMILCWGAAKWLQSRNIYIKL